MSETMKFGDTVPARWKAEGVDPVTNKPVKFDLTGFTVKLIARNWSARGVPIPLPAVVIDAPEGIVQWTPDGLLPVGSYDVELEATRELGEGLEPLIATFPNEGFARFTIDTDIR